MPHRCMECQNVVESGTIDLQKGCPICGGKKFQYIRPRPQPDASRAASSSTALSPTVSEYVAQAALREPQLEAKEAPLSRRPMNKPREAPASTETAASAEAKVSAKTATGRITERPPVEARREKAPERRPSRKPPEEKGDRVESVRIIEPGTYDINLPLLLSRKELVTSREEGDYTVDLNSVLKPPKKKRKK